MHFKILTLGLLFFTIAPNALGSRDIFSLYDGEKRVITIADYTGSTDFTKQIKLSGKWSCGNSEQVNRSGTLNFSPAGALNEPYLHSFYLWADTQYLSSWWVAYTCSAEVRAELSLPVSEGLDPLKLYSRLQIKRAKSAQELSELIAEGLNRFAIYRIHSTEISNPKLRRLISKVGPYFSAHVFVANPADRSLKNADKDGFYNLREMNISDVFLPMDKNHEMESARVYSLPDREGLVFPDLFWMGPDVQGFYKISLLFNNYHTITLDRKSLSRPIRSDEMPFTPAQMPAFYNQLSSKE